MKASTALLCSGLLFVCGCSSWTGKAVRSQSPDGKTNETAPKPQLVGDLAEPYGLHSVRIEGVGLVSGLNGTGSDPGPSAQRAMLVAEMRSRGVESPNSLLASKNFAMVLVQGYLRPGIQAGDSFDIEVRVPGQSETTSLRGGYLLPVRLRELKVLGNEVHDGQVLGIASGPILVDPSAKTEKGSVNACRGRVLSGGLAQKGRMLALVLKPDRQSVMYSARIEGALNKRFHTVMKGLQQGVAKAKTEKLIELLVHPRYKDNMERYMQVVRSVAVKEKPTGQVERLNRLRAELLVPATAGLAARQLEAIGRDGIEALRAGLTSPDREVRFYAAEALAYLDQREAAAPLAELAREEPAFRVFALSALGAMENRDACDQLETLLHVQSAETRYGAFRALWTSDKHFPAIVADPTIKDFGYHVLNSGGPPMVHVTRSKRPEVVLFGRDQALQPPFALNAGPQIMVTGRADSVTVSKFVPGQPDQKRVVAAQVDDVIRAIIDLGGAYPDVVQVLEEARKANALASRFEVDALPEAGREYQRMAKRADAPNGEQAGATAGKVQSPAPGLFRQSDAPGRAGAAAAAEKSPEKTAAKADAEPKKESAESFLTRIWKRE